MKCTIRVIFGKIIIYLQFGKTYLKRHSSNIRLSFESDNWTFFKDNEAVMSYQDLAGAPLTELATCKVFFWFFSFGHFENVFLEKRKILNFFWRLAVTRVAAVQWVWLSTLTKTSAQTESPLVPDQPILRVSIELADTHAYPKCLGMDLNWLSLFLVLL